MISPMVHLNGTSKQELLDQFCEAGRVMREAITAVNNARIHERDLYPLGPDAIFQARVEQEARMVKLQSVLEDMENLAEAVADSGRR